MSEIKKIRCNSKCMSSYMLMQQFVMALQMPWLNTEVVRYLPSQASTGFCSAGTVPKQ